MAAKERIWTWITRANLRTMARGAQLRKRALALFRQQRTKAWEALLQRAQAKHHRDGEIEIEDDATVSLSGDHGAYVQAWIWVYNSDAGVASCNDCDYFGLAAEFPRVIDNARQCPKCKSFGDNAFQDQFPEDDDGPE